mmetsp:Transcript_4839/g.13979  ORF Transcript_4839/g.13979 Transcript_4839/m.13979 type:complete len:214 (-) Transcript_4839:215-856(-)
MSPNKNSNNNKNSKGVHFNESVRVKYTIHVADYSDQEYFACWYDDDETRAMRQDIKNQLDAVRKGKVAVVPRGLESRTREGAAQKSRRKRFAWDAVMEEQRQQREEGLETDDEFVAAMYAQACRHSLAQAHIRGRMDEQVVYGAGAGAGATGNDASSSPASQPPSAPLSTSTPTPMPTSHKKSSLKSTAIVAPSSTDAETLRSKQRIIVGKAA